MRREKNKVAIPDNREGDQRLFSDIRLAKNRRMKAWLKMSYTIRFSTSSPLAILSRLSLVCSHIPYIELSYE